VGLVYDPRGLPGVTTVRPGVAEVLQMVSEPTLTVSRARMSQLRRIRWRTSQGCGYVRMMRGSSGRDTYGTYAANWTYDTCMPVLDIRTWSREDVPGLGLTDEDVDLLRGVDCDILTQGLIGLIEYSYHQDIPSFLEVHLQRTPGLSVFGLEQFQDG
jgi:hypothetical protein